MCRTLPIRSLAVALVMTAALASPALAHTGRSLEPHDAWTAWSWEPAVLAGLVLSAFLYVRGVAVIWRRAGVGRGVRRWEVAAYAGGCLTLVAALVSPLHAMGGVLFSVHMMQHELLMVVAAPLLVLGRPLVPFVWALPLRLRDSVGAVGRAPSVRAAWRWLTQPFTAWWTHAVVIWAWHIPRLFEATLQSELAHALQHVSFLGSALLFWWAVLPVRQRRASHGSVILYLFGTAAHTSALGALLTFSPMLWYPAYAATTAPWGLTPLEDQQLAGLVMWIPAGLAYPVAALALMSSWLRESSGRDERRESPALAVESR